MQSGSKREQRELGKVPWVSLRWFRSLRILPFPQDTHCLMEHLEATLRKALSSASQSLSANFSVARRGSVRVGGGENMYSSLGKWCHLVSSLGVCSDPACLDFLYHPHFLSQTISEHTIFHSTPRLCVALVYKCYFAISNPLK